MHGERCARSDARTDIVEQRIGDRPVVGLLSCQAESDRETLRIDDRCGHSANGDARLQAVVTRFQLIRPKTARSVEQV